MRKTLTLAFALALPALAQVPREAPAGMVLSDGASVARPPRPVASAKVGELLLVRDRVTAGSQGVLLLSCAEKRIVRLAPNSEAVVTAQGLESNGVALATDRLMSACFLPSVKRMPVAGKIHVGATTMRGDDGDAPPGSLQSRIDALPPAARDKLIEAWKTVHGGDAVAWLSRGALLEEAGLLSDAANSYVRALTQIPTAVWIQHKLVELADAREKLTQ